jgi:diguanylate cyclase (GGDEF)-like protein
MNEFFYVWPALYAGYFYRGRVTVAVVVAIAVSYCVVNAAIDIPIDTVAVRTLITLSVVAGTAVVAHALRAYVNGLVTRLDRLARLDVLTGLANRRYFDEQLAREFERVARAPQPLSLLVGDVDHFKQINDAFGHAAGDRVLNAIGVSLSASARKVDTAARIGGEEFALLMPNTDLDGAVAMANRLRLAFAKISDPAGNPIEITFGVSSTEHPDCVDAESLLLAADRALYTGKARGRDQTVAYRDPDGQLGDRHQRGSDQPVAHERLARA